MTYTTAAVHTGGRIHRRRTRRKISGRFGAVAVITTLMGVVLAGAIAAPAQSFSVLYTFTGQADGGEPDSALVPDGAGNFYGTTGFGGITSGACSNDGC